MCLSQDEAFGKQMKICTLDLMSYVKRTLSAVVSGCVDSITGISGESGICKQSLNSSQEWHANLWSTPIFFFTVEITRGNCNNNSEYDKT